MYLRLREDELKDKHRTRMLRVEVLESYRSNRLGGAPRNRLVFYAGSIPEYGMSKPEHQFRFWIGVDRRLDRMRFSPEIEQQIRDTILEKIARPATPLEAISSILTRWQKRQLSLKADTR